ncbi:hypothetical protein E2L06_07450 [Haloterrigena sp. H1]|uniref:hypothetical protein n=1 Tax=Haloterrigena sp. H1 TaxID=2552943 RepID=UPI00110E43E9|nr:hypothetical protein [Haloterrigena sp. H1]TMT86443.1 hypothetical protein E2L06_07450 [Haloterrigena sp. H1]
MANLPTRRGFLAAAGTGTVASIAGCSQLESITQNDSGSADGPLTVTVMPDQEQLTSYEQDLRQSIENGSITQQQAGQRFRDKQRELTEEAGAAIQDLAAANDDVTIEQSSPSYGFFLIDAPAATIIGALQSGDISAIYPRDRYEQFAQRRDQLQQQQAAADSQQGATNNSTDVSGDTNESTTGTES